MKISLTENDIRTAISQFIGSKGLGAVAAETITFSQTRNPTSINAEVDLDAIAPASTSEPIPRSAEITPIAEPGDEAVYVPVEDSTEEAEAPAESNSLFG